MISPEALSAEIPSRLALAREQLLDASLTPGEREAARRIVFEDCGGQPSNPGEGPE